MCKGIVGIFTENAKNKNNHSTICLSNSIFIFDKTLKEVDPTSKYKISIEKNKKIEPNSVYKKNKKLARIRRSLDPQTPIIKNIGIKILSKNTKKEIKSNDANDKIKKISNIKKYTQ